MASKNWYHHSESGYREVMQSVEIRNACEVQAGSLAASAARQSGIDYTIDSMNGLTRIHTRVSTSGAADFHRERNIRALTIAVGQAGGNMTGTKGYSNLASAHARSMRKHNRAAAKREKALRDRGLI